MHLSSSTLLLAASDLGRSLGSFGKALGPKELVREMREEVDDMRKVYRA